MNPKRWFLASLAAFAVVFVLDMIVHGKLLMGMYEETAAVWRPQEEANSLMWLMTLGQLLFAGAFTCFYTKGYEPAKPGLGQGLRFGLYVGILLAASSSFVWYVVLPVPFVLNLAWLASAFVDSLAAGAVVGIIYKSA